MTPSALDIGSRQRPASRQGHSIGEVAASWLLAMRGVVTARRMARDVAQRDAAAVRLMAHRYRQTDRGFAADLDAAADRHEELLSVTNPSR